MNMEKTEFWKISGSGNDFILMDNRDGKIVKKDIGRLVERICRRRKSVGADGLILVNESGQYDFAWQYFNADGGEVEMCGNGVRCAARFACLNNIAGKKMIFETKAGPVSAEVSGRIVKVLMPDPSDLKMDIDLPLIPGRLGADYINTGVPHVVVRVEDLKDYPVVEQGRDIRYNPLFAPEGTNADFIRITGPDLIEMRTYERGVEDETLACGTGAIASVLTASARGMVSSPTKVRTSGGDDLQIYYQKLGSCFNRVWLEGGTSIIYRAQLDEEAL